MPNGFRLSWIKWDSCASELLQTSFKKLMFIMGMQGQEHSCCIQGSHSLKVLLVNIRSLTGLDNYTPINRSSHYTWIKKDNGIIKCHALGCKGIICKCMTKLWENAHRQQKWDKYLHWWQQVWMNRNNVWDLTTHFSKQPDSKRAELQEWDNTTLGRLLCSSSTFFDKYPSYTARASVLFQ